MPRGLLPRGLRNLAIVERARVAALPAFGLAASLALAAPMFETPALALPASAAKDLHGTASAVEPAQLLKRHRKGPTLKTLKKSSTSRRPGATRIPSSTLVKVPGPRRPPDRDPSPDRHPRQPPHLAIPGLAPEQARFVSSLPRRAQRPPQGRPVPQRVTREILALVDQGQPQSLGPELARTYGLELLSSRPIVSLGARVELFRVRPGRSETSALAALQRDPRVRSAQFNLRYFHTSDGRRETVPIPQYGPRNVQLPDAHKLALGRNVVVAVIDSAVDTEHPDLKGAVVRSFDAVGGRDAAPDFHGTAVAGIIRARGIVEGVAPEAQIMAVRAMRTKSGSLPEANSADLLVGIDWAIRNGAKVLNMSFVNDQRDPALQALLQMAQQGRIVLVAAAGNKGPKAPPVFPAAYPGVIAVTAVDEKDRRYQQANRGPYIWVAAPGVDILAPVERGKHAFLSGTSFATAYVSGIAALLLERDPGVDAAAVAQLIAAGADDIGPAGRDDDFGAGRINALRALKSMQEAAARP
jgi:hypothetical protein